MKGPSDTGYFHICTDGRAISWMFQDEIDFIAGVNRIGICAFKIGIKVVAYVLMDNHVHFVLYGSLERCRDYINLYKRLTGTWILTRYGLSNYLKQLPTDIIRIESEESLLNTIAYLDRNPLMAGYPYMHGEYPWGSSKYLFKDQAHGSASLQENWKPISILPIRKQRSILHTRVILPGNWKINDSGMIHPLSFLDISRTESYYKSPMRYSYFLAKKLEGIVEQELEGAQKKFIPDRELRTIVLQMIKESYGTCDINSLGVTERLSLAKTLKHKYASTPKQISRMLHLELTTVNKFI